MPVPLITDFILGKVKLLISFKIFLIISPRSNLRVPLLASRRYSSNLNFIINVIYLLFNKIFLSISKITSDTEGSCLSCFNVIIITKVD